AGDAIPIGCAAGSKDGLSDLLKIADVGQPVLRNSETVSSAVVLNDNRRSTPAQRASFGNRGWTCPFPADDGAWHQTRSQTVQKKVSNPSSSVQHSTALDRHWGQRVPSASAANLRQSTHSVFVDGPL